MFAPPTPCLLTATCRRRLVSTLRDVGNLELRRAFKLCAVSPKSLLNTLNVNRVVSAELFLPQKLVLVFKVQSSMPSASTFWGSSGSAAAVISTSARR